MTFSVTALRGNFGKFAFNVETSSTFWVMDVIAAFKTFSKTFSWNLNSLSVISKESAQRIMVSYCLRSVFPLWSFWAVLKIEIKTWPNMSITPAAVVLKANKSPGWEVSTNILDCESLEGEAGEGGFVSCDKRNLNYFEGFQIFGRSSCKELAGGHTVAGACNRINWSSEGE